MNICYNGRVIRGTLIFLIMIMCPLYLSGSDVIQSPKTPDVPKVTFKDPVRKVISIRCEITLTGNKTFRALLVFDTGSITFRYKDRDKNQERLKQLDLHDVRSVAITGWSPVHFSKYGYRFMPVRYTIKTLDGREYRATGNITLLNVLQYNETVKSKIYSYFYDYWKKGAWYSTGSSQFSYPNTHPPDGTVIKIIFFNKQKPALNLRKFIK